MIVAEDELNNTVHTIILTLQVSAHSLLLGRPQEVIIIGAGISGLRCSEILNKENIPHLVIESKPQVGGRIAETLFGGMLVDKGASILYDFNLSRNPLARAAKQQGWAFSKADFDFHNIFYQQWEDLSDDEQEIKITNEKYQGYIQRIGSIAKAEKTPSSLEDLLNRVLKQHSHKDHDYQELIRLMIEIEKNMKGADLSQLSAQFTSLNQSNNSVYLLSTFFRFFQKLFPLDFTRLRLNQTVLSVDYSKDLIKVTTNRRVYLTKKLVSSIPLGVLQANTVVFTPPLPSLYHKAINNIGNGVVEKLFVSFQKPFWGQKKGWLNLMSNKHGTRYSTAFILPHTTEHVLIFYISGSDAVQVGKKTEPEILADLNKYLWLFFDEEDFQIKDVEYTTWHRDPNFQGSFSSFKVSTTPEDFAVLSKPIDKRLWLIGEHTHGKLNGLVQGAYETGERAARQILATFNRLVSLQYAQQNFPFKTRVYQKMISVRSLYKMLEEYQFKRIQ